MYFLCFYVSLTVCVVVFFSDILFNYSDVELPVCLINLLTYLYLLGYKQLKSSQVCSEPPPSALNMTLSVFGAKRRLGACSTALAAIDQYLLQILALSSKPAGHLCCCRSTGQTHGRTPGRYIDPAPHTMRAVPINWCLCFFCRSNYCDYCGVFADGADCECTGGISRHISMSAQVRL